MFLNSARATLLAVAVSVVAPFVHASEPTDEDREVAQTAFARGMEQRARGDDRGALASFTLAHDRLPSPITAIELGRAHMRLGEFVAARAYFDEAMRSLPKPGESENAKAARADAGSLFDEANRKVATITIEVRGTDATTAVATVDGASVLLRGVLTAHDVDPGKHVVSIRLGARTRRSDVEVSPGVGRLVTFVFDDSVGSAHELPQPADRSTPTWIYASLGAGAAGIGIGSVAGIVALSERSSLGCSAGRCTGSSSDVDGLNHAATVATVSFLFGLAGAGVGLYGLLSAGDRSPSPRTSRIEPWIGLGSVGVTGSF